MNRSRLIALLFESLFQLRQIEQVADHSLGWLRLGQVLASRDCHKNKVGERQGLVITSPSKAATLINFTFEHSPLSRKIAAHSYNTCTSILDSLGIASA